MFFDDPSKRLKEMEEALKAAEREDALPEEGDLEEFMEEDWLEEAKVLLGDAPAAPQPRRPQPRQTEPRRPAPKKPSGDFMEAVYDDEAPVDGRAVVPTRPKKKGAGGLVILALLELAAIAAVALWWLKWL